MDRSPPLTPGPGKVPEPGTIRTVTVAAAVALVCALVISTFSVLLKPLQDANVAAERQALIDAMLDTLPGMRDLMLETGVDALDTRLVDLASGEVVEAADAVAYDMLNAAQDPESSIVLSPEADLASIKRRSTHAPIHLLQKDGDLILLVLPVYGTGYASTIQAMLALEADLSTIAAFIILDQGETPGFGARIMEPEWQAQWSGKTALDAAGEPQIKVVKDGASTPFEVDGITGATRTSNGVQFMLQFWLGPDGYGPFLARLLSEGI